VLVTLPSASLTMVNRRSGSKVFVTLVLSGRV